MTEAERDKALLGVLQPDERAHLETLVEKFISDELPEISVDLLHQAADHFEDRAAALRTADGIGGRVFAALLRERAGLFST